MNHGLAFMLWLGGFAVGGTAGYYLKCLVDDLRMTDHDKIGEFGQGR